MSLTQIILDKGYQMLYLDQRGMGFSSTITADTLALQGSAQKQADYLKLFRADSIIKDCEAIREVLTNDYPTELKKWSIMGQSYGGFCAMTYLSNSPESLRGSTSQLTQPFELRVIELNTDTESLNRSLHMRRNSTYWQICKGGLHRDLQDRPMS
jgi:hypothetical protein